MASITNKISLLFMLIGLSKFYAVFASNDSLIINITKKLESYYQKYPQQKAFLHIDKDNYIAGENIWFSAYLLNATNHTLDTFNTCLYVELVNALNNTIEVKVLKMQDGISSGKFELSDSLITGPYRIYAYTNFMRNFDQRFIFVKEIFIESKINYVYKKEYREYKKKNKEAEIKRNTVEVGFYPEGGNLVNGLETNVVFRITNGLGEPVKKNGEIKDALGNSVIALESDENGIGVFKLKPDISQQYKVYLSDNSKQSFNLPDILEKGTVLNIKNEKDKITCNISTVDVNKTFYLIGHERGKVYYAKEILFSGSKSSVEIEPSVFTNGVVHFTVFNSNQIPVAERLVFVNNQDLPSVLIMRYDKGNVSNDSLQYVVRTTSIEQEPLISVVSISINNTAVNKPKGESILTYLLFNSDISGKIENPLQYLNPTNDSRQKLDQLMIAQEWKRFTWENILSGTKKKDMVFEMEKGLSLSGKVERSDFKSDFADIVISLKIDDKENSEIIVSKTNGLGEFKFSGLDYFGEVDARLDAKESDMGKSMKIIIEKYSGPDFTDYTYKPVDISGFKIKKGKLVNQANSDNSNGGKVYGYADYTLHFDENMQSYSSVMEAMKGRVPGMEINSGKIVIRGTKTFYGPTDPLLLIDGVICEIDRINTISPREVDKVDILSGASASAFGSRGANGVICVYTRKGDEINRGSLEFTFKGFERSEEFQKSKPQNVSGAELNQQTIFWKTEIITNVYGYGMFKFKKPDFENYSITAEGISIEGIPISMSHNF